MKNIVIESPLSLKKTVKKYDEFLVSDICEKYREYGVDVSSYFRGLSQIDLYECTQTGYRFYWPLRVVGDAKFYENLSTNKTNYYSNRWEHQIALSKLSKKDKTLEVGSGFGAFLKLLNENNIIAKGLELNPHAVKQCKKNGFDVEEKLVQTEAKDYKGLYDAVCYFQVLEHIAEVHSFVSASVALLKKGGKLIIGVPNNNPYLFINDKYHTLNLPPHHAGLWNKKSLLSLQDLFGLKLDYIEFEPLDVSYNYFIKFHQKNGGNKLSKYILKILHKKTPKLLQKILCSMIKGRNVLVVFKKL